MLKGAFFCSSCLPWSCAEKKATSEGSTPHVHGGSFVVSRAEAFHAGCPVANVGGWKTAALRNPPSFLPSFSNDFHNNQRKTPTPSLSLTTPPKTRTHPRALARPPSHVFARPPETKKIHPTTTNTKTNKTARKERHRGPRGRRRDPPRKPGRVRGVPPTGPGVFLVRALLRQEDQGGARVGDHSQRGRDGAALLDHGRWPRAHFPGARGTHIYFCRRVCVCLLLCKRRLVGGALLNGASQRLIYGASSPVYRRRAGFDAQSTPMISREASDRKLLTVVKSPREAAAASVREKWVPKRRSPHGDKHTLCGGWRHLHSHPPDSSHQTRVSMSPE